MAATQQRAASVASAAGQQPAGGDAAEEKAEYDWEEPRLAMEGFVTDYMVRRAQQDGLEWHEAPDVPAGAEQEHGAMARMCAIFEERQREDLEEIIAELMEEENFTIAKYYEMIEGFGASDVVTVRNEMTYGRMVGLLSLAGLLGAELLRAGRRRDVSLAALYTARFLDDRLRATWVDSARSWAGFMEMTKQVTQRHAAGRPSAAAAATATVNRQSAAGAVPKEAETARAAREEMERRRARRSSLLYLAVGAGIAAVGTMVYARTLMTR